MFIISWILFPVCPPVFGITGLVAVLMMVFSPIGSFLVGFAIACAVCWGFYGFEPNYNQAIHCGIAGIIGGFFVMKIFGNMKSKIKPKPEKSNSKENQ
jgi:hypothetical protein